MTGKTNNISIIIEKSARHKLAKGVISSTHAFSCDIKAITHMKGGIYMDDFRVYNYTQEEFISAGMPLNYSDCLPYLAHLFSENILWKILA